VIPLEARAASESRIRVCAAGTPRHVGSGATVGTRPRERAPGAEERMMRTINRFAVPLTQSPDPVPGLLRQPGIESHVPQAHSLA
jgi:hypothetical protein